MDCPECGELFAPRGLASHRRMRHGLAPEAAAELAGTLTRIASVLERLDQKLSHPPEPRTPASGDPDAVPPLLPSSPAESPAARLLEQGLHEVLEEIARVKRETEGQIAHLNGKPLTNEQKLLEQTAFTALATLRRRQAELIYKIQTETGADGNALDALASL